MDCIKGRLKGIASVNDLIKIIEELNLTKQDTLVNQLNIKSINGESILGKGNLDIASTLEYYLKEAEVSGSSLIIRDAQDKVVVNFTPITEEDKQNLKKLEDIVDKMSKVDERLDSMEASVIELEEFKENFQFSDKEINY